MSSSTLEHTERQRAADAGQTHVFDHWEVLDEAARGTLLGQLKSVDYGLMKRLAAKLVGPSDSTAAPRLEPPELFPRLRTGAYAERAASAEERGSGHFAAGKVGFMIVAGGQGSRLGFEGPKGCFPIGPVTDRSLFAYHAARLRAAGQRHGFVPTWYVMTSPLNELDTRAFFAEHDYFQLGADNVFFFSQAMLPAVDMQGRLLMSEPHSLFLAPNGHGGSLAALSESGAIAHMRARGIETISYFQVDNPLARPGDTLFVGLHVAANAGMSSKVVAKRDAHEKVGVIGRVNGALGCIEYSDLSDELRDARDADGQLLFRAGNIAVHMLDVGFVEQLNQTGELDLPWHIAKKEMNVLAPDGARVNVLGAKFETFVFDALAQSPSSITLEVDRAHEFSPVKNKSGADSADSCRADLQAVFGQIAPKSPQPLEICPAFAENAAEFSARSGAAPEEHAAGWVFA